MRRKAIIAPPAALALAAGGFFGLVPGIVERGQNKVTAHAPWPVSPAAQTLHDRLIIGD